MHEYLSDGETFHLFAIGVHFESSNADAVSTYVACRQLLSLNYTMD